MKQSTSELKWLSAVPAILQPLMRTLENTANIALEQESPYHSVRIDEDHIIAAGNDGGRIPAWVISLTTHVGWEYENTTYDRHGTMWILFKNPYVFS